ncbi:hypothetical protein BJY01DRAFT_210674 [Aspergillus pseudoustus]|uniref:Zinc-ribbon domain-containing protein n=1 Tax=Aspergillus pseudoustus TaxID=1810923 RepID=A0ABR4KCI9_9EURO
MLDHPSQFVMQPPVLATTLPPSRRISKWFPISMITIGFIFIAVGGALISVWSSRDNHSEDDQYYGAVSCFVIAGVCQLAGWIILIIYCVQTRRSEGVYFSYADHPPANQTQPTYSPRPVPSPRYLKCPVSQSRLNGKRRCCPECGAVLIAPFCTECPAKI